MAKETFLPLRLKRLYGMRKMSMFYPELQLNTISWTYRDLLNLYQDCFKRGDVEALQLLTEKYDLEEIQRFDSTYHDERPLTQKYTSFQKERILMRQYDREKMQWKSRYHGSQKFMYMFKTLPGGKVIFSARKCVYSMTGDQMRQLFQLSDCDPGLRKDPLLTEMFDAMCRHPERDRLILFYLKYMIGKGFPVEDIEDISNGTIEIVDSF